MTTYRLAWPGDLFSGQFGAEALQGALPQTEDKSMTTCRLAVPYDPSQGIEAVFGTAAAVQSSAAPAFLVSYVFLPRFQERRDKLLIRDWVLDSGAFSAWNSGTTIDLDRYIATCQELLATDPTLTEVYSLDVIQDWKATIRNTELMWKAGVPAIPTFHMGSPEDALMHLARTYPKIALSGKGRARTGWARRCFARVWPKPIHGFAFGEEKLVLSLPFHSVDATSWASVFRFGRWQSMGGRNLGIRGAVAKDIGIRVECEYYARIERRAQALWGKQLRALDYQPARCA